MGQLRYETLIKKLESQGAKPRPYSGRCMFGEYCVGVSLDYIGQYDLPRGFRLDQLGMGHIAYWTSYKWKDKDEKVSLHLRSQD